MFGSRRRAFTYTYHRRQQSYHSERVATRDALKTLGLAVSGSHTKDEIKKRFRELAKRHHPDLQHQCHSNEAPNSVQSRDGDKTDGEHEAGVYSDAAMTMVDLIEAYTLLMDDSIDLMESKVALACEIYTVAELRGSEFHEVNLMSLTLSTHPFVNKC